MKRTSRRALIHNAKDRYSIGNADVDRGAIDVLALYPSRRLLEPRVRRFIDLLAQELGR